MNERLVCEWLNKKLFKKNNLKLTWDDKFKSWDVFNKNYIGELKHRHMPYYKYRNEGYILEKLKFTKLIEESENKKKYPDGADILYINSFDDTAGTIAIWNLSDLIKKNYSFNWHLKSMKKTTYFSNNSQIKKMISLLKDDIVKVKYNRYV